MKPEKIQRYTIAILEKLKAEGKIVGYSGVRVEQVTPAGRIVAKHFQRKSVGLDFVSSNLFYWCRERKLVLLEEFKFDPARNWRLDFAIPALKVGVEYEGSIQNPNGDHRSVKGITRDMNKYNSAAALGWTILRFGSTNYKTLISELEKLVK